MTTMATIAATSGELEMARRIAWHEMERAREAADAAGWDRESKARALDALDAYQESVGRLERFLAAEKSGGIPCTRQAPRPWRAPAPPRIA